MVVHGATYRIQTPVGIAFITLNTNGGNPPEPLEMFINVGKGREQMSTQWPRFGKNDFSSLEFFISFFGLIKGSTKLLPSYQE